MEIGFVINVEGLPVCFRWRAREDEQEDECQSVQGGEGDRSNDSVLPTLVVGSLSKTSVEEQNRAFCAAS